MLLLSLKSQRLLGRKIAFPAQSFYSNNLDFLFCLPCPFITCQPIAKLKKGKKGGGITAFSCLQQFHPLNLASTDFFYFTFWQKLLNARNEKGSDSILHSLENSKMSERWLIQSFWIRCCWHIQENELAVGEDDWQGQPFKHGQSFPLAVVCLKR